MLKNAFAFLGLTFLSPMVLATSFNDFYVGAAIGISEAIFQTNEGTNIAANIAGTPILFLPTTNKQKLTNQSLIGNIDVGFGHVFKQYFYAGLEFNADAQNLKTKHRRANVMETVSRFNLSGNTRASLGNEYAFTFNPGIVFNNITLLYSKIGTAWGRFTTSGQVNYSQNFGSPGPASSAMTSFHNKGYKQGLRLGLGLEHYVSEHVSLNFDYVYTNYRKVHSGKNSIGNISVDNPSFPLQGTLTDSSIIKASNNAILIGFNYHFS